MAAMTVKDLRQLLDELSKHRDIEDWEIEIEVAFANDGPVYAVPCDIALPTHEKLVFGSSEDIGAKK